MKAPWQLLCSFQNCEHVHNWQLAVHDGSQLYYMEKRETETEKEMKMEMGTFAQ